MEPNGANRLDESLKYKRYDRDFIDIIFLSLYSVLSREFEFSVHDIDRLNELVKKEIYKRQLERG